MSHGFIQYVPVNFFIVSLLIGQRFIGFIACKRAVTFKNKLAPRWLILNLKIFLKNSISL